MEKQERPASFEAACEILKKNPDEILISGLDKSEIALRKIKTICDSVNLLNDNWEGNLFDSNQPKYFPWHQYKKGAGLVYDGYVFTYSSAFMPSRLYVGTVADAEYIGKQFIELYKDYLIEKP